MSKITPCSICNWEKANGITVDLSMSSKKWGERVGVHRTSITRHLGHSSNATGVKSTGESVGYSKEVGSNGSLAITKRADRIIPLSEWLQDLRDDGLEPDDYSHSFGHSVWGQQPRDGELVTLYANKFTATLKTAKEKGVPDWPVVQQGPAHVVRSRATRAIPSIETWQTAVLMADTQFGFRVLSDGSMEPFHDEAAIEVALAIVEIENPQQTVVMGDILDLASQGKFSQEAGFARTTQPAIDRTTLFGAQMRQATSGKIVWLEGNHDKRMQNFVEANALAAFGLRRGGVPDSWPVMSLPNLLRLDEVDIEYKDAYPTAHHWVNDKLRCEHGTKANSAGSTAAQYMNETPHISRAHGHTHRLEAQSKTTYDRVGKIRSVAINPGCLCRTDGAVPSVNGAIGADGRSATIVENWQQGVAVVRFRPSGEFFWDLVQIEDGKTVYQGQEISCSPSAA